VVNERIFARPPFGQAARHILPTLGAVEESPRRVPRSDGHDAKQVECQDGIMEATNLFHIQNNSVVVDPICRTASRTKSLRINLKKALNCRRFCAEKASDFTKSQQVSTSGVQQVQYQSVRNNKFQQVSIRVGIWFGTPSPQEKEAG
jgi:hypothetical protein